jgi:hypothetical protein
MNKPTTLREEFYEKFGIYHTTNSASITPSSTPSEYVYFKNGDERDLPEQIVNWWLDKFSSHNTELLQKIEGMIPIKAPVQRKGFYKRGFYEGCKFVNAELKYKLHVLREEMKSLINQYK